MVCDQRPLGTTHDREAEIYLSTSLLGLEHVADQVDDAVAVAPLVVVPRDELDEVVVQGNPGLGVEDARPG
jgi:hypothetical protein